MCYAHFPLMTSVSLHSLAQKGSHDHDISELVSNAC
jgi:hypothetical protein